MYNWPLAISNFTFLDRLKICKFFLNPNNRWTQGPKVFEYENLVAKYVGCKYAVLVSSGSSANQLICQEIKDRLVRNNEWPRKNKVVVSSVTWQTNVSVWVREGFEPIFLDVNLDDFCLNYEQLENVLSKKSDEIACVFPTSVLGYVPNMNKLIEICESWNVELKFDNCENFFGKFNNQNINNYTTCSTSNFPAHHITTGSEGGFIFTNSEEEYKYYLLSRAHGLLRNLFPYWDEKKFPFNDYSKYRNHLVDKNFDFQTLSSNYRSTDIQAYMGILDFKRSDKYEYHRFVIYNNFYQQLDFGKYYLPPVRSNIEDCAFCLPIISKNSLRLPKIKKYLDDNKIEWRGFISGNMLRQIPYQKYGNYKDFKNAEYLNNNAIYIGLHTGVSESMVKQLCKDLNQL